MATDYTLGGDRAREVAAGPIPAAANQPAPTGATTRQKVLDYLAKISPGMMAFVEHPELGPILAEAAAKEFDSVRLQNALSGTRWWRDRTSAQRKFDLNEQTDPQNNVANINTQFSVLSRKARVLGIAVPDTQLRTLARDVVRNDLSDQEATDILVSYMNPSLAASSQGKIGGASALIRRQYAQYGLPISEDTLADMAKRYALGELDPNALDGMIIAQAKARYPNMAALLDQGVTPMQYFAPIKETVARELEINPESIDIFDPKYSEVLNMPLWQAQQWARAKPEWRSTNAANEKANALVQTIAQAFGKVA